MELEWPKQRPQRPFPIGGWLTPETYAFLRTGATQARTIIEVGSWMGKSTRLLAESNPTARIHCIDTWQGGKEHQGDPRLKNLLQAFQWNLWDYREQITMHQGKSQEILPELEVEPDLIYIDGSHAYEDVLQDLMACIRKWPTTTIIGDDWHMKPVRRAAREANESLDNLYLDLIHEGNVFALIGRRKVPPVGFLPYWWLRSFLHRILRIPYRYYMGVAQ